jgi:hypothetical protein
MNGTPELHASLQSACARVNRLRTGKSLLIWGAFLAGTLFLLIGLDIWASFESPALRWTVSALAWLAWAGFLGRELWRVLARRPDTLQMARHLEDRHPEWQETLSTALELEREAAVSPRVKARIAAQAQSALAGADLESAFPGQALRPAGRLLAMAALLLLALFALWPQAAWTSLTRLLAPWADPGNAFADQLEVLPGDQILAVGSELDIQARYLGERAEIAYLLCETSEGKQTRERMPLTPPPAAATNTVAATGYAYALRLPNLRHSFTYRVVAGRAKSKPYKVQVEALPDFTELRAKITPPAYSQLGVATNLWEVEPLTTLVGSRIELTGALNKPVRSAAYRSPVATAPAAELPPHGAYARWEVVSQTEATGEWTFTLVDQYGFTNAPLARLFRAVPDQAPRISILQPRLNELQMRPTDLLRIEYAVEEDFGIARAELVVQGSRKKDLAQPLPVRDSTGLWRGAAVLNLPDLEAKPGHTYKVRVRVTDNLPEEFKGPHLASSTELVIRIQDSAGSVARQQVEKFNREMEKSLNQAQQKLNEARAKAENQKNQLADKPEIPEWLQKELEAMQQALAEARKELDPQADFHRNTAEAMKELAEKLEPAQEQAEQIALQDSPAERAETAQELAERLAEALRELEQLRQEFNRERQQAEQWARLQEIADKQEQLALTAERAESPEQQQQWQNQQKDLAQQAADLVRQNPEAQADLAQDVAKNAQSLSEQLQQASEQQNQLSQANQQAAQQQPEAAQQSLRQALAEEQRELAAAIQQLAQESGAKEPAGSPEASRPPENPAGAENPPGSPPSTPEAGQTSPAPAPESGTPEASPAGETPPAGAEGTPEGTETSPPSAAEALQQAAQAAQSAAQALDQGDVAAAKAAAQQAAQSLAQAEQAAAAESGSPEGGTPESGQPEGGQPEGGQPEGGQPEGGQPEGGQPEGGQPEGGQPEAGQPEGGQPEGGQPEGSQPEGGSPEGGAPAGGEGEGLPEQAGDLQARQEALAEALAALEQGLAQGLAAAQETAAGEVDALAGEAAALAQQAQALSPAAAQAAQQAAGQSQSGAQQAEAAAQSAQAFAEQSAQSPANTGAAAQAAAQEAAAAQSLSQAAQSAAQAAQAAAQAGQAAQSAAAQPGAESSFVEGQPLSDGFQAATQAAQAPGQGEAGQLASQAAQQLRAAAAQASPGPPSPGQPGQPGQPSQPPQVAGGPASETSGTAEAFGAGSLGGLFSGLFTPANRNWARVQGTLKTGVAGDRSGDVPEDYQELVREYFQAIHKQTGTP